MREFWVTLWFTSFGEPCLNWQSHLLPLLLSKQWFFFKFVSHLWIILTVFPFYLTKTSLCPEKYNIAFKMLCPIGFFSFPLTKSCPPLPERPTLALLQLWLSKRCFPSFSDELGPGYGISQSSRLSSSVSAMRVLNTGSDVEEAVADALVLLFIFLSMYCSYSKPPCASPRGWACWMKPKKLTCRQYK